jgi:hypothetical protein
MSPALGLSLTIYRLLLLVLLRLTQWFTYELFELVVLQLLLSLQEFRLVPNWRVSK